MKRAVIYLGDTGDWENAIRVVIVGRERHGLEPFAQECHDYIDRIVDKWEAELQDED